MRGIKGISALSVSVAMLPSVTAAANVLSVLSFFASLFNGLIGLMVSVAIVVFFWGLVQYLWEVDKKKHEGLQIMLYGIIAIFVMVSIWGIIGLLQNQFGIAGENNALTPSTPSFSPYAKTQMN